MEWVRRDFIRNDRKWNGEEYETTGNGMERNMKRPEMEWRGNGRDRKSLD